MLASPPPSTSRNSDHAHQGGCTAFLEIARVQDAVCPGDVGLCKGDNVEFAQGGAPGDLPTGCSHGKSPREPSVHPPLEMETPREGESLGIGGRDSAHGGGEPASGCIDNASGVTSPSPRAAAQSVPGGPGGWERVATLRLLPLDSDSEAAALLSGPPRDVGGGGWGAGGGGGRVWGGGSALSRVVEGGGEGVSVRVRGVLSSARVSPVGFLVGGAFVCREEEVKEEEDGGGDESGMDEGDAGGGGGGGEGEGGGATAGGRLERLVRVLASAGEVLAVEVVQVR